MTAIQDLTEKVITRIKDIPSIKYVGQEQGQLFNPAGFQAFSTPAVLVRPEINNVVQQLGNQYFDISFVCTIIIKETTKLGETTFTLYDVGNEIYKKLQGNHFSQSCTPMLRINLEQDYVFLDRNFGFTTFKTNVTDNSAIDSNGYTFSVTPDFRVISDYGSTQSKIDDYEHNG